MYVFFSVRISSPTETCLDTNLNSYAISGRYSGTICNVLSHHKCLCLHWHLITRQVSVKAAPALLHENGKIPLSLLIPPLCGAYTFTVCFQVATPQYSMMKFQLSSLTYFHPLTSDLNPAANTPRSPNILVLHSPTCHSLSPPDWSTTRLPWVNQ